MNHDVRSPHVKLQNKYQADSEVAVLRKPRDKLVLNSYNYLRVSFLGPTGIDRSIDGHPRTSSPRTKSPTSVQRQFDAMKTTISPLLALVVLQQIWTVSGAPSTGLDLAVYDTWCREQFHDESSANTCIELAENGRGACFECGPCVTEDVPADLTPCSPDACTNLKTEMDHCGKCSRKVCGHKTPHMAPFPEANGVCQCSGDNTVCSYGYCVSCEPGRTFCVLQVHSGYPFGECHLLESSNEHCGACKNKVRGEQTEFTSPTKR